MSEQSATDFVEKIKTDENLQNGLKGMVGDLLSGDGDIMQKIVDFAKSKGFDFIKPELGKILGGTDIGALLAHPALQKILGGADVSSLLGGLGGGASGSSSGGVDLGGLLGGLMGKK